MSCLNLSDSFFKKTLFISVDLGVDSHTNPTFHTWAHCLFVRTVFLRLESYAAYDNNNYKRCYSVQQTHIFLLDELSNSLPASNLIV